MRHDVDALIEPGDRMNTMLAPQMHNEHTAMLTIGEFGNDVTLKFRQLDAIGKLIAELSSLEQEWRGMRDAAKGSSSRNSRIGCGSKASTQTTRRTAFAPDR